MLHATRVRICFVSFLMLIDNVQLESVSVTAADGDTVVLLCQIDNSPQDVYWRFKDTGKLYDIADGEVRLWDQAIKDRVHVFPSEIKNGNFSLRLDQVSKSDEGSYSCSAPSVGRHTVLELKVTDKREKSGMKVEAGTASPSSGQSPGRADVLLVFLLGSALLHSLTV